MVMTCFSAPRLNPVLGRDDMVLGTRAESRCRSRAMEVSRHSSWVGRSSSSVDEHSHGGLAGQQPTVPTNIAR